jgi:outer membrane biogenesis lipoprotein LolB
MRFARGACAAVLALLLASCAPTRESLLLDTRQVSAQQVMQAVRSAATPVAAFAGGGSVSVESPQASGSVFFSIVMRKPDSLLIRLEGPFGIDVGFLFMSRSHVVLYNAMENWYMDEPTGSAGMRSVLPISLPFDQMMDAFTGTFHLPAAGSPVSYVIDDDRFLLKFRQDADTASYWVDPELRVVTRYRIARGDSTIVEASADRFTEEGGHLMPRGVTVTIPTSAQSVSVYYSSLDPDPSTVSFVRTIPQRAHRRALR